MEDKAFCYCIIFYMKKLAILFTVLVLAAFPAYADEISLSAEATPVRLPPGEAFRLTITVSGSDARKAPEPVLPRLKYFEIAGKSTSQQISMTDFTKINVTKTIVYQVIANKEGTFKIPPVSLKYKGKTYKTDPIKIIVDSNAPIPSGPRTARRRSLFPDFGSAFDDPFPPRATRVAKNDLFITMETDKVEVVPYEQVIATFSFYNAVNLWETPNYDKPDFSGFWVEEMIFENGKKEKTSTEEIKGKLYNVTKIRYALAPLMVGKSKIGKATLTAKIDPWSRSRKLFTKPVTINVKPYPEEGKPEGFTNMVGSYKLTSSVKPLNPSVNESMTLRITIEGEGYLKPVPPPSKPSIPGAEVFDPKVTDTFDVKGAVARSVRVIEYPVIPREAGEKTVAPIKFAWYDPAQKKYVVAETKPVKVLVSPSGTPASVPALSRSEVTRLNNGLRGLKADVLTLEDYRSPPHRKWWVWFVTLLPAPIILAAWVMGRKKKRLLNDSVYARKTSAAKVAADRLNEIRKLKDQKDFYAKLDKTLRGYLSDIWEIPSPSINSGVVRTMLADSKNGIADGLSSLLERMEYARYAPSSTTDMNRDLEKAKDFIREMEKNR